MRCTADRATSIVGLVAIVLVLASAAWRGDFGAAPYLQRVFIVAGGAILATMAAAGRAGTARDRERFAALAAVAEIADGARSLQDTVAALNDLLVPAIADVCVIDAVSQGQLQRLAVRVGGRDGERSRRGSPRARRLARRTIGLQMRRPCSPSRSATSW